MDDSTFSNLLQPSSQMCKYFFCTGKKFFVFCFFFQCGKMNFFAVTPDIWPLDWSRGHCGKPQLNSKWSLLGTVPVLRVAPSWLPSFSFPQREFHFHFPPSIQSDGLPKPFNWAHPQSKMNAKNDTSFPTQSRQSGCLYILSFFWKGVGGGMLGGKKHENFDQPGKETQKVNSPD